MKWIKLLLPQYIYIYTAFDKCFMALAIIHSCMKNAPKNVNLTAVPKSARKRHSIRDALNMSCIRHEPEEPGEARRRARRAREGPGGTRVIAVILAIQWDLSLESLTPCFPQTPHTACGQDCSGGGRGRWEEVGGSKAGSSLLPSPPCFAWLPLAPPCSSLLLLASPSSFWLPLAPPDSS